MKHFNRNKFRSTFKQAMCAITMVISTLPLVAKAETWLHLANAADNTSLFVDVESIRIESIALKDNQRTKMVIGRFRLVGSDNIPPVIAAISAEECLKRQSGVIVNILDQDQYVVYNWSSNQRRMYDLEGQFLCNYLIGFSSKTPAKQKM